MNHYKEDAHLLNAHGFDRSVSNDGFDNITVSTAKQSFRVVGDRARLEKVENHSETRRYGFLDNSGEVKVISEQINDSTMNYQFRKDRDFGNHVGALETGTFEGKEYVISTDEAGNIISDGTKFVESKGSLINGYNRVINGQVKLTRSVVTTETTRLDGISEEDVTGRTVTTDVRSTVYGYNKNGRMTGAESENEGTGSMTKVYTEKGELLSVTYAIPDIEYEVINDQARAKNTETVSITYNLMEGEARSAPVSVSDIEDNVIPAFLTDVSQLREELRRPGMAEKLEEGQGRFDVLIGEVDGIRSPVELNFAALQLVRVDYRNDQRTGRVLSAEGSGEFKNQDWGFADTLAQPGVMTRTSVTRGSMEQDFEVIKGNALLKESRSWSLTENRDGGTVETLQTTPNLTVNSYNQYGQLIGGTATNRSIQIDVGTDGPNNRTLNTSTQKMVVILGESRALWSESVSDSTPLDKDGNTMGSNHQENRVDFVYDDKTSRLIDATGSGTSWGLDKFGNFTRGTLTQDFEIKANQARVTKTVNKTDTENINESFNHQEITVENTYAKNGFLLSSKGQGFFLNDDGNGSVSEGDIDQLFRIILGQSRLHTNTTRTDSIGPDGSFNGQRVIVNYTYDTNTGHLLDADGEGTIDGIDAEGNITKGTIDQDYEVILNQARILRSKTITDVEHIDEADTHQELTLNYINDDQKGLLV
ncbi:hypothetical protein BVX98_00685, partial [bacterium F11]